MAHVVARSDAAALFCIETGHGNLAGARECAVDYLKPINDQPNRAAPGPVGYFYWLSGDSKTAMIWFRNAYTRTPGPHTCFNLILLADEIGDSATRDEMIRVLLSQCDAALSGQRRPG